MISVVIITYNEERHLEDCLQSLQGLSNDIVVIDAESTDNTVTIARESGVRVVTERWKGYGHARNLGADLALNDWIFSLDADERCSPLLIDSLQKQHFQKESLYSCKRSNRYRGRFMKNGYLGPEWKTRVYHKHFARWDERPVHEVLQTTSKPGIQKLDGQLLHLAYDSYDELLQKLYSYAVLARSSDDPGPKWLRRIKFWISPSFHFIRTYFLQLGILEGKRGLETSKAALRYTRYKYNPSEHSR